MGRGFTGCRWILYLCWLLVPQVLSAFGQTSYENGNLLPVKPEATDPADATRAEPVDPIGELSGESNPESRICSPHPVLPFLLPKPPTFSQPSGKQLAIVVAFAPWSVPHWLLQDSMQDTAFLLPYPYSQEERGYLLIDDAGIFDPRIRWEGSWRPLTWGGNTFFTAGGNRDDCRIGLDTLLESHNRIGLAIGWLHWQRPPERGDWATADTFDLDFVFRFAQAQQIQMRTGIGARMQALGGDFAVGAHWLYAIEIQPIRPLTLSGQLEAAWPAGDPQWNARVGLGILGWGPIEVFAGYEWLRIDRSHLQSPLAGLRLWF